MDQELDRCVEYSIEVRYFGKESQAPDRVFSNQMALEFGAERSKIFRRVMDVDGKGRPSDWVEIPVTSDRPR